MTAAAAILAVLLAHPSWSDRELKPDNRAAAIQPVAEAIADAARNPRETAVLVALGLHESGFALAVVAGDCASLGPRACDSGKARGVWQLHEAACRAAYAFAAGSVESIRAEARCAIAQLRFHAARCRKHAATPELGAFSGFATGSACHWGGAEARVRTTRSVERELAERSDRQ